ADERSTSEAATEFGDLITEARNGLASDGTGGAGEALPTGEALQAEAERLDERYAPSLDPSFHVRARSGEVGVSRLLEGGVPFALEVSPQRAAGRLTVRGELVYLGAGSPNLGDPQTARSFGMLAFAPPGAWHASTESAGFAASARYDRPGLLV